MSDNRLVGLLPAGVIDGLLIGLVAVVPALVVWLAFGRSAVPIGGILVMVVAAAAVAGPPTVGGGATAAVGLTLGALLAGAGGLVGRRYDLALILRVIALGPGAVVAVLALEPEGATWSVVAAIVTAAVLGAGAEVVDEQLGAGGLTLAMVGVSAAGVLVTLPETGLIAPVAGAIVVLAALGWPLGVLRLGPGGGAVAVAILAAIVADGSVIRSGGIVGGLAAPGLLALLALPRGSRPGPFDRPLATPTVQLLALHVVVTLAVTRIAGLNDQAAVALVQVGFILTIGWWLGNRIVPPSGAGRDAPAGSLGDPAGPSGP